MLWRPRGKFAALSALGVSLALWLAACGGGSADPGQISGAGSSVAAPLIRRWGEAMAQRGLKVAYRGVGSGRGVARLSDDSVDFAASGSAVSAVEFEATEKFGPTVYVPLAASAIAVVYNLPGIDAGLKLDGKTVGDIYVGRVRRWDDPEIASLNPSLKLPHLPVVVLHRADEAAATAAFTHFLDRHNDPWARRIGSDQTVRWPTGRGVTGNGQMAAEAARTRGAIAYVSLAFALENELCCDLGSSGGGSISPAAVQNSSGNFVLPSTRSTEAAEVGIDPKTMVIDLADSPNADAYPIASPVLALVYRDMCRAKKDEQTAEDVAELLSFAIGRGQDEAAKLDYAPLTPPLMAAARAALASLRCAGKPVEPASSSG